MPCDQIRTTSIEWTEQTDTNHLASALEEMGFEITLKEAGRLTAVDRSGSYRGLVRFEEGSLTFETLDVEELKCRYSDSVVSEMEKFGWELEEQDQEREASLGFTREW